MRCALTPRSLVQVRLNSGFQMPSVGFGTAGLGEQTVMAVEAALTAGYKLVDSAQVFEQLMNERCGTSA